MRIMASTFDVLVIETHRWHLQANDNSTGGWLAFCLYLVLSILCWREVAKQYSATGVADRALSPRFWLCFSLGVTALGINKQLDLQTWLIQFGRGIAESQGVIEYRRLVQALFVALAAIATAFAASYLWRLARRATNPERLVIIGTTALLGFVLLRVASMNNIDPIGRGINLHRPILALEVATLTILCVAVWRNARSS